MGAVYKARQLGLDRLVALKILPPEVGADPAFAERFAREARALAKLSHQNIVSVFDFGQADGLYYFIMEYVDGANLRHVIETGAVKPEEALAIVPQICEALQFAHDEGIVHRDIKPENILVDKQGRVKIADFGLAKLLGKAPAEIPLTGTQQVMGTPHYMAPEQMQGAGAVDHRADIYSLGVVFYELLTGELPIGRFAPPSKKVQVHVRLDEVVLRALENEPNRRYQRVSEIKTDLEAISRSTTPPESAAADFGPEDEQFRRWMLSHLPITKSAAIRAYRDQTGAGCFKAIDAVDAIARKHGIQFARVSLRELLVVAAIFGTAVVASQYRQYLDLSPIINWTIRFVCVAPIIYSAWHHRSTKLGRLAAVFVGFSFVAYIGLPLTRYFVHPEPVLEWLYQITGVPPGQHDAEFITAATVLGFLAWLICFWRKLRAERPVMKQARMQFEKRDVPRILLATLGGGLLATMLCSLAGANLGEAVLLGLAMGVPGGAAGGAIGCMIGRYVEKE
jgi:predicted Ser/Thr protein kinase